MTVWLTNWNGSFLVEMTLQLELWIFFSHRNITFQMRYCCFLSRVIFLSELLHFSDKLNLHWHYPTNFHIFGPLELQLFMTHTINITSVNDTFLFWVNYFYKSGVLWHIIDYFLCHMVLFWGRNFLFAENRVCYRKTPLYELWLIAFINFMLCHLLPYYHWRIYFHLTKSLDLGMIQKKFSINFLSK